MGDNMCFTLAFDKCVACTKAEQPRVDNVDVSISPQGWVLVPSSPSSPRHLPSPPVHLFKFCQELVEYMF